MSPLIGILVFCTDGSRCRGSPISSASAFGSPAGCRISQPFPRAHGRMSADIRTGGTPIRWMGAWAVLSDEPRRPCTASTVRERKRAGCWRILQHPARGVTHAVWRIRTVIGSFGGMHAVLDGRGPATCAQEGHADTAEGDEGQQDAADGHAGLGEILAVAAPVVGVRIHGGVLA